MNNGITAQWYYGQGHRSRGGRMKRRIASMAVVISLIVLLMPAERARANPSNQVTFNVWYSCICSPCTRSLEGQWLLDCDNSFTGWGWEPGHNCTETETITGNSCPGGGCPDPNDCGPDNRT